MTAAESFFGALLGAPDLQGAVCKGCSETWCPGEDVDPETAAEREQLALKGCQQCPVLPQCEEYLTSLPPSQRPPGVVAGRVNGAAQTTKRKEIA